MVQAFTEKHPWQPCCEHWGSAGRDVGAGRMPQALLSVCLSVLGDLGNLFHHSTLLALSVAALNSL